MSQTEHSLLAKLQRTTNPIGIKTMPSDVARVPNMLTLCDGCEMRIENIKHKTETTTKNMFSSFQRNGRGMHFVLT